MEYTGGRTDWEEQAKMASYLRATSKKEFRFIIHFLEVLYFFKSLTGKNENSFNNIQMSLSEFVCHILKKRDDLRRLLCLRL